MCLDANTANMKGQVRWLPCYAPAMATGSLTLTEYPSDAVVVACDRCDRRGRLNKAKLIAEYGPDAALPYTKGYGNDLCRARFAGL